MAKNTTQLPPALDSLLPSEASALACYRDFREQLPPVKSARGIRKKPSEALEAARMFARSAREARGYEDPLSRLDALHDAGEALGADIRAALDWLIDRDTATTNNPMIAKSVVLGELLKEPDEPVRWLVEDTLPAGRFVAAYRATEGREDDPRPVPRGGGGARPSVARARVRPRPGALPGARRTARLRAAAFFEARGARR